MELVVEPGLKLAIDAVIYNSSSSITAPVHLFYAAATYWLKSDQVLLNLPDWRCFNLYRMLRVAEAYGCLKLWEEHYNRSQTRFMSCWRS